MTVLFMRIHLNFLFSHKLPLINQLSLINRRVAFIFQWYSLVKYSFLSEMLQSGNYIPLVKGYLKIRIICNMYDFFWRLWWWNLLNSPQKYQMYDSNKINGFEIFPSVGFTFCPRKCSSWYQDGVGNAWRPNERTKIMLKRLFPCIIQPFMYTWLRLGLCQCYGVMEREPIWDSPLGLWM